MRFRDKYFFLSNFYPAEIIVDGVKYSTTEHYYQAMKCDDKEDADRVKECSTPGQAKRLARKCRMRSDWLKVRVNVMTRALEAKFTQHPELKDLLIMTGDIPLIESNYWHDNFWGDCECSKCEGAGQNILGALLMRLRSGLTRSEERKLW